MNKFEVLLVDDEENYLELLSELIEDIGEFKPVFFTSPVEALKYIEEYSTRIVLIISDFNMPDVNGFQFRMSMLPTFGEIPFVIMTGFWNKDQAREAMEYKIQSFSDKVFDEEKIKNLIDKYSDARKSQLVEQIEMIQGFIEESYSMLDDIENLILKLEENDDTEETLQIYFRLLHTIKGTAACVGLSNLADYSHQYEDFISEIRNGVYTINNISMNILLGGLDKLKQIFDVIVESGEDRLDISADTKKFLDYKEDKDTKVSPVDDNPVSDADSNVLNFIDTKKEKKEEKALVSMGILDHFLEESGELTVLRNAIVKTVKNIEERHKGDKEFDTLNDLLDGMQSITSGIQSSISYLRKVPIKTVFRPYKRLVRDLSRSLGKEIVLDTEGDELLIDSRLAKLFSNTLIHLIRNAVDHGIESAEERQRFEKESCGRIFLRAYEANEQIYIEIKDDGRGMDQSRLIEKALENDLYSSEELSQMSSQEIFALVFHSGFSTAKEVTDVSGRGVGMDMVLSSVVDKGGCINVDSKLTEGSTFTLEVPIPKSVFIINSLLVKCNEQTYVIPIDFVLEILKVDASDSSKISFIEGQKLLKHQDNLYDILSLNKQLGVIENDREDLNLVIIKSKLGVFALQMDEVIGFEEVVVRKINKNINNNDFYKGASLLGDSEVALILDMDHLSKVNQLTLSKEKNSEIVNEDAEFETIEYMQFELEKKSNFAIGLDKVYRLEKFHRDKVSFTGDLGIVKYIDTIMPLVNIDHRLGFSDDIHSHLKNDDEFLDVIVVKQNQRYFGLVVNCISDIGLSESDFYTDIANLTGIMGSTFINGKNIAILDVTYLTNTKPLETTEDSKDSIGHRSNIDRMKMAA